MTTALILIIALHQYSIGNIGNKTDGATCKDFCLQKGFNASGMPPKDTGDRTCICYDNIGSEALKVLIDRIHKD